MQIRNELRRLRERRGIAAADLARAAGVARQTIYAIEAGSFVPNTAVALRLARALDVKVEDLFRLETEADPSATVRAEVLAAVRLDAGQPVQLCRVGKRAIAAPVTPYPVYLPAADGMADADRVRLCDPPEWRRRILVAGCDPGISLLAQELRQAAQVEVVAAPSSSRQALEWLKQGKVHVAGSHLRDAASGEYNVPLVRRLFPRGGFQVVTFASWEQGLVVARGNPKGIRSPADLARRDVRIINREPGAGSRDLLDVKLGEAGVQPGRVRGYDRTAPGHLGAALAVSLGQADACVATRAAARAFGLDFLPWAAERYDLVILTRHRASPGVEALLEALCRSRLRRRLEALAGYDASHMGEERR